jgi:Flp pilus assembly protein TadD
VPGIILPSRVALDRAVAALETASALAPRDASILNNLGFLRMVVGDMEHAVAPLTQAVALDGKNPKYQTNLSYALAALQHDDDAWSGFRALTGDAEAHARLGLVAELRHDVDAARRRYRDALTADPQNFTASSGMARLETMERP